MTVTVEDGPYFSAEGSFLSVLQIDDPTKASADDGVNEHGLLGSDVSQVKEGPETVNVYFKARSKDDDNGHRSTSRRGRGAGSSCPECR